jgi:hypothetical protein
MRNVLLLALAFVVASTAGCSAMQSHFYRDYGVGPLTVDANAPIVKLRTAIENSGKGAGGLVDSDCFEVPLASTANETQCRQERNNAIAVLFAASDDMCQAHLKTIFGNDASFNIVTGSLATLLSGTATVVAPATAKSIFAGLSTFANAERSLVNETVYKNMIVTAVTQKIREARDTRMATMIPSNFGKSMSDYPMQAALRDVMTYHYTCSFMLGLERALQEGTQPSADAQSAKLEQTKQTLEAYRDSRVQMHSQQGRDAKTDPGVTEAATRISAIGARLLAITNGQAPAQAVAPAVQTGADKGN